VDRCRQSFLRRFDLEHTFRLFNTGRRVLLTQDRGLLRRRVLRLAPACGASALITSSGT
jgi:hypothetical protein